MFRKFLRLVVLPLATVMAVSGSASAAGGNAHFIKHATGASLSGSSLVVNFKETGLAAGSAEAIQTTATATAVYECVNGGGNNPSASNKTTTVTAVSETGTFTADKNGNLVGSQTLTPPTASDLGFACPPGQTTTFVSVTYSNVIVTDLTSGASYAIPGTFSYTNPLAP